MSTTMQDDPEAYWNEHAGPRWVAAQAALDQVMAPISDSILAAAKLAPGERVADIGCGAGSLSLAAAEAVGPAGQVTAVDISTPLLDHTRARAAAAGVALDAVRADAQDYAFAAGSLDAVVSRFGVMFFRNSAAAFANLARALTGEGRCVFACWQAVDTNPWITWPVAAIADMLPEEARGGGLPVDGDAPGPFRFADAARTRAMLEAAGFAAVEIEGHDQALHVRGSTDEIMAMLLQVGPLSRALEALDPAAAEEATARVRARAQAMREADGLRQRGAWWVVSARR